MYMHVCMRAPHDVRVLSCLNSTIRRALLCFVCVCLLCAFPAWQQIGGGMSFIRWELSLCIVLKTRERCSCCCWCVAGCQIRQLLLVGGLLPHQGAEAHVAHRCNCSSFSSCLLAAATRDR